MYFQYHTPKFKKSLKKILHSGKVGRSEIEDVTSVLSLGKKLENKYRDHKLLGEYAGYRECHIRPDLLLLYKIDKKSKVLVLINLGSHSEIF